MDKARDTRWICSRTLIAALVIQALTPDALDLTLLANHRPPVPVFAIMSMLVEEREAEGELRFTTDDDDESRSSLTQSSPGEYPSDPPTDNVMLPLWPELGLSRTVSRSSGVLAQIGSTWHALVVESSQGRHGFRSSIGSTPGKDLFLSTLRMTC
jgi:hypothetical protein